MATPSERAAVAVRHHNHLRVDSSEPRDKEINPLQLARLRDWLFRHPLTQYNAEIGALPAGVPIVPFSSYRESFEPETLAVLEAAFNAAGDAVVTSGVNCDQQKTRTALADAIVYFASEGETDPKKLKELALAALPRALGL